MLNFYKCSFGFREETDWVGFKLVGKISEKEEVPSSTKASYVRTKKMFKLVKMHVMSIRGSRKMCFPNLDVRDVEVVPRIGVIRE